MLKSFVALALAAAAAAQTPPREVAITIDDLPGRFAPGETIEMTKRLLAPIRSRRIPVTAFVIGSRCGDTGPLKLWTDAGAELGNHTWSHPGLNDTPIADYEREILQTGTLLAKLTGRAPRWFRSPMLQTGADTATKERLERFLAEHGYRQAAVTLDNSDWMFAYLYQRGGDALAKRVRESYVPYLESVIAFFERRSIEVVGREFPQVMLLHANKLNAEMLPAVLAMFERRGYKFVSLDDAFGDPVYALPNRYAGRGGFSWIHRWSMTKGMAAKGEPDEPAWLREAYERLR